ncbi:thioredoxin domain-containing protein [Dactylosporangium roseum]|uniref:Thioredoxin domain-containing protein n=1 Tax=Dactylosporangium roseum TaxID=47989 RepID=A0ABY5Z4X5_9ACTN|nr:thioredoxin domain-containing protein [Dactylosporangium roseum]UWZ35907.1 thioredoxin domain-containing protein [Dactylosporangium roseum]
MNRLGSATSPYLLQHADNPVDWWPWGGDAFAEAKRRDVPVLISVGYAACHWCHVMAHESFEHEGVAELVNELTVPIKVDREERPDVDAIYMTATQAMTGQGGWPMTVFATPEGEPFYCGTYFPRDAFLRLVRAVADAWQHQRDAVRRQSGAVVDAIRQVAARPPANPMTGPVLDAAAATLLRDYDSEHGGFGGAPKFPPHMALLFLLRHYQRTRRQEVVDVVRYTCERMARGGMYDQLAGGFARYAVDGTWTVPHFEKMLYDNALLLRVYTQLDRIAGNNTARRVAVETAAFLERDLYDGHGFISALDADTDGVEGLTYVWTPQQIDEVVGEIDGAWARYLLEVSPEGTFEHGSSVLQLPEDPRNVERWLGIKQRLLAARDERPQPAKDGKVVAAWNGLAVTALIEFGMVYDRPDAVRRAVDVATFLAETHLVDGRLRRVSRDGVVGAPAGVLEDYGAVAEAFCVVHQATGEGRWLDLARQLLDVALEHFAEPGGGFYDTADDAETLVARPADVTDNATPSGLSAVTAALVTYAALTADTKYREAAERALSTVAAVAATHGRFTGYACAVGEALLSGPFEIAIATPDGHGGAEDPLVAAAWWHAPPGAVVVAGEPDRAGVPLLEGRVLREGRPTAYVCRGFVCDAPVTGLEDLVGRLG